MATRGPENPIPSDFSYTIEHPQAPLEATILWHLGQDDLSRHARLLDPGLVARDTSLLVRLANRDESTFSRVTSIVGRALTAKVNSVRVWGANYDRLELSGFGFHPFTQLESGATIDLASPVRLPSNENFAESHNGVTWTRVVDADGKFQELHDAFSFTGAYTFDQTVRKLASSLFFLEHLQYARKDKPTPIPPIPVAAGIYPGIRGPSGEPAYFIGFRVPYGGARTGYAPFIRPEDLMENYVQMIETFPRIGEAARYMHDELGLTHNQFTTSNVYLPADRNLPVYIADLATVHPVSREKPLVSRMHELTYGISHLMNFLEHRMTMPDKDAVREFLFSRTLRDYGLSHLQDQIQRNPLVRSVIPPLTEESLYRNMLLYLNMAQQQKMIPDVSLKAQQNWARIVAIRGQLEQTLRVA